MTDNAFEARLRETLNRHMPDRADALIGAYHRALEYLRSNVYEEIRAKEQDLSDHGPRHINNVQNNIISLLPENDDAMSPISAVELYLLAMFTLFHDVGNIHKREDHQRNIGDVFDAARGSLAATRREKTLVLRACAAHTGQGSDGTRDTLKELPEIEQFEGKPVRLRELAAILRFADELAEGPQRTSEYRLDHDDYAPNSRVYHEYASVTDILIDRGNQRISLAFEIPVDVDSDLSSERERALQYLFAHILSRITKLDEERRYAVHYTPLLSPFKATIASFNFHCAGNILDVDLPEIRLDDFTVPGTKKTSLDEDIPTYSPLTLAKRLIVLCQQAKDVG